MKYILLIFLTFFLSSCEMQNPFGPNENEVKISENEIKIKEKELNTQLELQKSEKELELAKIKSDIEKSQIQLEKEKVNAQALQFNSDNETTKLIIIAVILMTAIIAATLFVYFNNRRKDKLRAYEDNLEKYYRQKDRDAKVQIANKIIDTISSGKLSKDQENRLLSALSDEKPQNTQAVLEEEISSNEDEVLQLDYKEDKKKKKKKKKKKSHSS